MATAHPGVTGRRPGDRDRLIEPLAVSPRQACLLLGIGNTRLYELIMTASWSHTMKVGRVGLLWSPSTDGWLAWLVVAPPRRPLRPAAVGGRANGQSGTRSHDRRRNRRSARRGTRGRPWLAMPLSAPWRPYFGGSRQPHWPRAGNMLEWLRSPSRARRAATARFPTFRNALLRRLRIKVRSLWTSLAVARKPHPRSRPQWPPLLP
jgi:hypothetical protein